MHSIHIKPVDNGFEVHVGCATLVYTSAESLISDLRSYLNDPQITEKRVLKDCYNRRYLRPATVDPLPASPAYNPAYTQEFAAQQAAPIKVT